MLRELLFAAQAEVLSPPFAVGTRPVGQWFEQEGALRVLMSQAESSVRLDAGGSGGEQIWEVSTPIQFPGMVARSATTMRVAIDGAAPEIRMASGESKTVCEGGPAWARAFLARISEISRTESSNLVEVRDVPGGNKVYASTVKLTVKLDLPPLLPVPVAAFEKAGSDAIQKLLDKDMAPTLSKFRDAYIQWAK